MIHLRPIEARPRKKCDTQALEHLRQDVKRQLNDYKLEKLHDARLPRHFKEREQFRLKGETS